MKQMSSYQEFKKDVSDTIWLIFALVIVLFLALLAGAGLSIQLIAEMLLGPGCLDEGLWGRVVWWTSVAVMQWVLAAMAAEARTDGRGDVVGALVVLNLACMAIWGIMMFLNDYVLFHFLNMILAFAVVYILPIPLLVAWVAYGLNYLKERRYFLTTVHFLGYPIWMLLAKILGLIFMRRTEFSDF